MFPGEGRGEAAGAGPRAVLRSARVKARALGRPTTEQLACDRKDLPTPVTIGMDLDGVLSGMSPRRRTNPV